MTRILALDTSTEACSCALIDGSGVVREDYAVIPRQHAGQLLPMIRRLLDAAGLELDQLDALAFGRGPGSFTGLRIAAGVTQGLAFAADLPVVPVSTLATLAWQAKRDHGCEQVLACLDARIDELYWACYQCSDEGVVLLGEEHLCRPELMQPAQVNELFDTASFAAIGNGLEYRERIPGVIGDAIGQSFPELLPRAGAMAELALRELQAGNTVDAEQVQPVYLRDKVTRN